MSLLWSKRYIKRVLGIIDSPEFVSDQNLGGLSGVAFCVQITIQIASHKNEHRYPQGHSVGRGPRHRHTGNCQLAPCQGVRDPYRKIRRHRLSSLNSFLSSTMKWLSNPALGRRSTTATKYYTDAGGEILNEPSFFKGCVPEHRHRDGCS